MTPPHPRKPGREHLRPEALGRARVRDHRRAQRADGRRRIEVTLPGALVEALRAHAQAHGMSLSAAVERLLRTALGREHDNPKGDDDHANQ